MGTPEHSLAFSQGRITFIWADGHAAHHPPEQKPRLCQLLQEQSCGPGVQLEQGLVHLLPDGVRVVGRPQHPHQTVHRDAGLGVFALCTRPTATMALSGSNGFLLLLEDCSDVPAQLDNLRAGEKEGAKGSRCVCLPGESCAHDLRTPRLPEAPPLCPRPLPTPLPRLLLPPRGLFFPNQGALK